MDLDLVKLLNAYGTFDVHTAIEFLLMVGWSPILLFGLALLTSPALQEAQDCYESLDYVCADQQLALAL